MDSETPKTPRTRKTSAKKSTASKKKAASTKKVTTKKTAAKKTVRKTTARKTTARKAAPRKATKPSAEAQAKHGRTITAEERYRMIAEAAYYIAERRGFAPGDPTLDWRLAEAEIDARLLDDA